MNISHLKYYTRESWRGKVILWLVEWTTPIYICWFKRRKKAWQMSKSDLLKYPQISLAHHLGEFLHHANIDLMPFLEDHDVMHVLMGFKTSIKDEIGMQFFLVGNGKRSLYAFGTAFLGAFLMPEYWSYYRQQYQIGKQCLSIFKWDFQFLLKEPIEVLRNQIFQIEQEAPLFI